MTTNGNGLSVLAYKCAPNVFDISTGLVNVSIRDQIVRARLLIADLHQKTNAKRVLIIGAGVAGVSAAAMASHLGIEALVVDTKKQPFSLMVGVKERFVGPFMYEWPSVWFNNQSYPLAMSPGWGAGPLTPQWNSPSPISADALAGALTLWLQTTKFGLFMPQFCFDIGEKEISSFVTKFVKHSRTKSNKTSLLEIFRTGRDCVDGHGKSQNVKAFSPEFVIFATGIGTEKVSLNTKIAGMPFWDRATPAAGSFADLSVGVFGSGDGALQDALRHVTAHPHPIDFINSLNSQGSFVNAIQGEAQLLLELEHQCRATVAWGVGDVHEKLDKACHSIALKVANPAVQALVLSQLRPGNGKVTLIMRESYLTKAYLLNRFCIHLIDVCLCGKVAPGKVSMEILKETLVESAEKKANIFEIITISGPTSLRTQHRFNHIEVRYGVDKLEDKGSQQIKISKKTKADRLSMAGLTLPFVHGR